MKIYTVVSTSPGLYSIYDSSTGAQRSRFNIPGQLVSGPMVSASSCSITTKTGDTTTTYIVRLPDGAIINRFCT